TSLAGKLAPPGPPDVWENGPARRVSSPGRPPELRVVRKAPKTRGLASKEGRARALHAFLHHELQAAELMAWAVLAFPETPLEFREGLVRIAKDEIRHMRIYAEQIERLGFHVGDFEVRDWFWERVPTARTPASFAARFRAAGDEDGARAQEIVAREEIAHVRFGVRWFEELGAPLAFDAWRRALPEPLSPLLMRGTPIARDARRKAGQPERFIDELEAWSEDSPGS